VTAGVGRWNALSTHSQRPRSHCFVESLGIPSWRPSLGVLITRRAPPPRNCADQDGLPARPSDAVLWSSVIPPARSPGERRGAVPPRPRYQRCSRAKISPRAGIGRAQAADRPPPRFNVAGAERRSGKLVLALWAMTLGRHQAGLWRY
jgi:hypothetical protein